MFTEAVCTHAHLDWPPRREQRARYIGEWLKTEARYLGS